MIKTAAHTMMCPICSQVVKTVKGDNAKQYFRCHVSHPYAKLEVESKKICVENLKKSVQQQPSCMSSFIKSTNSRCEASCRVAYHLGVAGKPFSDGELVKRCFIDVVHSGKKTTIHRFLSRELRFNASKMI